MFYSDVLLQGHGGLARAWTLANFDAKVSRSQVIRSNVPDSVEAILTPNQAPMALRLTSQLLLGVTRMYDRKTRYLLDDCHEAINKFRMAFKSSGNNDLAESHRTVDRETLMIPNKISHLDNLDIPDFDIDPYWMDINSSTPIVPSNSNEINRRNRAINMREDHSSQLFNGSTQFEDDLDMAVPNIDEGLQLDFDSDDDEPPSKAVDNSIDIEMGRDAPALPFDDDFVTDLGFGAPYKDTTLADRERSPGHDLDFSDDLVAIADGDGDIAMDDDFFFDNGDRSAAPAMPSARPDPSRARISESPLSDMDDDLAREVEEFNLSHRRSLYEADVEAAEDAPTRSRPQRKKPKLIVADETTMLSKVIIKHQQAHREHMLKKEQTFVPRDPCLLMLVGLRKSGGFVSSVLFGGRTAAWAPELRGLMSLESLRPVTDEASLKRKRLGDLTDGDAAHPFKSPRLDVGEDDHAFSVAGARDGIGNDTTVTPDGTVIEVPANGSGGASMLADGGGSAFDDDDRVNQSAGPAFDDTVAPHLHPAHGGPVSLGTKHAVHVLRDVFGDEAATSAEKRMRSAVLFNDLLPERRATKPDATRMFFECLVLATKDAIKIEQRDPDVMGGPIRIRGKRGLWGPWAEREAVTGEGDAQQAPSRPPAEQAGPREAGRLMDDVGMGAPASVSVEA